MRNLFLLLLSAVFTATIVGCATAPKMVVYEEPKVILAVEIGSKGVKGKIFNARAGNNGTYDIQEMSDQREINSNVTDGFDEIKHPYLKPEKITETTNAIANMIRDMKNEYLISEDNIHIFGSSAIIKAKNTDALFLAIMEQTHKQVQFIDVKDEVFYGFINSVPLDMQNRALLIDIGSGNTKMGYYDIRTKSSQSVDIPYGTKSFLDTVILKKAKYLLQPADLGNFARLAHLLAGYHKGLNKGIQPNNPQNARDLALESILDQLSMESHVSISGYRTADVNRPPPPELLDSLLFDLNSIIIDNNRFSASFYPALFPGSSEEDVSKRNRAILEEVLSLPKTEVRQQLSARDFDLLGRIVIRERLREKLKFNPDLALRKPTYMTGGIIWAFLTLTHPETVDLGSIPFTYDEVVQFRKRLADNPEAMFSTQRMIDEKISSRAFKEIQFIRQSAFTFDELASGISILASVLEEMNLTNETIHFVRSAGWYKGAILSKLDSNFFISAKSAGSSDQNAMAKDTDEGIFDKDGRVYIKVRDRSLLSIIDEVAYKLRVNYTVQNDLSGYAVSLFDNCERNTDSKAFLKANWTKVKSRSFGSIDELLDLLNVLQDSNGRKIILPYERLGDGIVFKNPKLAEFPGSYKKVFLNSITTKDAEEALKKLYFAHEQEFTLSNQPLPALTLGSSTTAPPPMPAPGARYVTFDKAKVINDAVISIPGQNAVVIKAGNDVLAMMSDIIASLDAKSPQVLIETKVFQVADSISKKIGAAIDYSKTNGATSYGMKTILQEGLSVSSLPNWFFNLTDPEKKLKLLTDLVANDRDGLVKILAEPRIVMKPGEEAAIALNTVKYVSVTGVQTSDLKPVETGITFKITPIILSENKISLRLAIEQSEFIPTNEDKVTLSTSKNTIYTTVIADDGEMISIGGIESRRFTDFASGIPYLMDIPLLGSLFASKAKDSTNTKIEFMIKPVIKKLNMYQKQNTVDMLHERMTIDTDAASNLNFYIK
jgi:hypothetical protein